MRAFVVAAIDEEPGRAARRRHFAESDFLSALHVPNSAKNHTQLE
jgi:hypothetical protein